MDFDDNLMTQYGLFLDKLYSITDRYEMADEHSAALFSICNLSMMVTNMIHEDMGETRYTESIVDELYSELPQDVADDVIVELCDYNNTDNTRPKVVGDLITILKTKKGMCLQSVTPMREEDTMIFTFVNLE